MALTRPRYSQIYDSDYKQSVRVATTGDVGNLLATGNMTNTVDGKSLAVADRILVKDQSDTKQNGIYRVATVGTGSDGTWIRATDADANDKVTSGMTTTVAEGDTHSSKTFNLATPDPITLGVTGLTFINPFVAGSAAAPGANTQVQFNDSGDAGASAGLTFNKAGNILTVGNSVVLTQLVGNANVTVTGSMLPSANITYDLGSPTQRWREGWFAGSTIHIGSESISVDTNGPWAFTSDGTTVELGKNNDFNPSSANVAGAVTAGSINVTGFVSQGTGTYVTRQYVLHGTTTNATETEILTVGAGTRMPVNTNTTVLYDIHIVARRTDATGESAAWELEGCTDNFSGTVADVGDVYEIVVAQDDVTWAVDARADDTNNSINLYVTGAANKTIRWTAVVKTIEVAE
jgi:hypothetical protein